MGRASERQSVHCKCTLFLIHETTSLVSLISFSTRRFVPAAWLQIRGLGGDGDGAEESDVGLTNTDDIEAARRQEAELQRAEEETEEKQREAQALAAVRVFIRLKSQNMEDGPEFMQQVLGACNLGFVADKFIEEEIVYLYKNVKEGCLLGCEPEVRCQLHSHSDPHAV